MGFRNAIVSGLTLVREAIQSVGYVPGSSGWAINRDGSAEFSDATVRGELDVSSPSGQHVRINSSGLLPQIIFTSADGTKEAVINAAADETLAGDRAWLGMNPSPNIDSDLVERKGRLFLLGSQSRLEVVRQSDQLFDGGHLFLDKDQTFIATGTVDARAAIQVARIYVLLKGQAFTSADAVVRLARELIQNDVIRIEVLKNDTQQNDGGKVLLQHNQALIGYHDVDGGIDNRIALFNTGISLIVTDGVIQLVSDIPTTSSRVLRDGNSILPNVMVHRTVTVANTTSATFVNVGTAKNFTKHFDDTRLAIQVAATCTSTAVDTVAVYGVNINGADSTATKIRLGAVGVRGTAPNGYAERTGLAAGTYSVQGRWLRASGAGTLNMDVDDQIAFMVMEVAP